MQAAVVVTALVALLAVPSAAQSRDSDGDGLSNRYERKRSHTNPHRADTDRDGLRDRFELRRSHTNPRARDTDGDGLRDRFELRRSHTNPRLRDTDGDGYDDGLEMLMGSDPRIPGDTRALIAPSPLEPDPTPPAPPPGTPESPPGTSDPLPLPADTTPPDTAITSGPSGTVTTASAGFAFSSSEPGSAFHCMLDAGSWTPCFSPRTYSGLSNGSHTFSVRATDAAGNVDATPATRTWTVDVSSPPPPPPPSGDCSTTLAAGADVNAAIRSAAAGSVICLSGGSYPGLSLSGVRKAGYVTVRSADGQTATVPGGNLSHVGFLRFERLRITNALTVQPDGDDLQFIANEVTGRAGLRFFGDSRIGHQIERVLIEGNNIHDIDWTGDQCPSCGYGIQGLGAAYHVTIRGNTIKSTASDFLQSASPENWIVDGNTFLGPSLMLPNHPDEHQDLWQIFGGGSDITFTNNVVRDTAVTTGLLFQTGLFSNVRIENNLLVRDSRGYSCQLYNTQGLVFRQNTVIGSRWGCLFRDSGSLGTGGGYQIDHNVFTGTTDNQDVSTEGRASSWGTYDWNVSEDQSADGPNSVRGWTPRWVDTTWYEPDGLPFAAGFRRP